MGEWRGPGTHFALLVLALGFAYQTWTRDEQAAVRPTSGHVVVLGGAPSQLDFVELVSPRGRVRLERRSDDAGSYLWGTSERDEGKQRLGFVGGEAADELVANLAPLKALGALGKPDSAARKDYGLDAAQDTLRISIGGKVHELRIGARLYGGEDRYAELATTGDVFVLAGERLLNALEGGPVALMQHELHRSDKGNPTLMVIHRGEKKRGLVILSGSEPGWADEKQPDVKNEAASRWAAMLHSITILEFVDPARVAAFELPAQKLLLVEYFGADRAKIGFIEIVKATSKEAAYYIRTERTRGLGKISQQLGQQLEKDVGPVLGVD